MDFQAGLIVLIVFVSLFAIWLIFYFIPVGLWFSALVSGVRISLPVSYTHLTLPTIA